MQCIYLLTTKQYHAIGYGGEKEGESYETLVLAEKAKGKNQTFYPSFHSGEDADQYIKNNNLKNIQILALDIFNNKENI